MKRRRFFTSLIAAMALSAMDVFGQQEVAAITGSKTYPNYFWPPILDIWEDVDPAAFAEGTHKISVANIQEFPHDRHRLKPPCRRPRPALPVQHHRTARVNRSLRGR